MELGRHVKEHRARLGMSQEQLAEAIFVSRQTISNWETDRTYPDVASGRNREAGRMWWGKSIAKNVIAVIVGLCFGWGLISILDHLIN